VSNDTKIAKLNADEVDGLSAGTFQRKVARISASTSANASSAHTVPAGSVGPWTFRLTCRGLAPSSGGIATFKITGPGTVGGAHTVASDGNDGPTFVAAEGAIGSGHLTFADTNEQVSATYFLRSGSTLAEVDVLLTATNNAPPENCDLVGAATLIG
jgi:hypothetical protein